MDHRQAAERGHCDLVDDRAALGEITRRIAAYRSREASPPGELESRRRELIAHFASISQGR